MRKPIYKFQIILVPVTKNGGTERNSLLERIHYFQICQPFEVIRVSRGKLQIVYHSGSSYDGIGKFDITMPSQIDCLIRNLFTDRKYIT